MPRANNPYANTQRLRGCQHCRHWRTHDPNDHTGRCHFFESMPGRPVWMVAPAIAHTRFDEGKQCPAWEYDMGLSPHPLDLAEEQLLPIEPGDKLPMRTYERNAAISRGTAKVVRVMPKHALIFFMNATYRLRLHDTSEGPAGSVVHLPTWGVDTAREFEPADSRKIAHAKAVEWLRKVRPGDKLPLLSYLDDKTVTATVVERKGEKLHLKLPRKERAVMHRSGLLAGVVVGEVWGLDVREEPTFLGDNR